MTELEQAYLAHHGILGQKWGRRNGPPYPLDESDHSAAEKKDLSKSLSGKRHEEMYSRNQKGNSEKSEKKEFHLTDKQKKYIKIGAAVAATALVAYGGYKLSKNPNVRAAVAKGMQAVKKTELPENVGSIINPKGLKNNCKEVSEAFLKRRLGIDPKAIAGEKTVTGNLHDFIDAKKYNKDGVKWITESGGISPDPSGDSTARVTKQILKHFKEGSCGYVGVSWDKKYLPPNAKETAHAFNWYIENGRVFFPDNQPDQPLTNAVKHFKMIDPNIEIEICEIMKEAFAK